jgi:hypothetical protein
MATKQQREALYEQELREVRPGIVRWNLEWPTEVKARFFLAAQASGHWPSVLLRAIVIDWLNARTLSRPPPTNVSPTALAVARSPKEGNEMMRAHYGEADELAQIFGLKELAK